MRPKGRGFHPQTLMNGLIPTTVDEFVTELEPTISPSQCPKSAMRGTVLNVLNLLGALDDARLLQTVRNCSGTEIKFNLIHRRPE